MFSGIGGFELGIQKAIPGAECVGFSEIDKYAIQIYQNHYPTHHNYGNATTIIASELPNFDLLVGGFPCQAFSIVGKRKGFNDTRGTLFFDIARILKEKRPRLFLLENVKGLLSHDDGRTFKTIIATLIELGYDCQWQVLNSKDFGVPQNRERVFIVGHLRGTAPPEIFPVTEGYQQNQKTIISTALDSNYWKGIDNHGQRTHISCGRELNRRIRRLTPTECERLQAFPYDWTRNVSDTQRYKILGNAVTVNVVEYLTRQLN
jgi:DNA (cytosine-5)-methyltransferase 1